MTPRVKPPHTLVSVLHWLWYCRATALSALANLTLLLGKNTLPFPALGNLNFVSPPHRRAYTSIPKSCPNIRFPHQQDFFPIRSVTKSSTAWPIIFHFCARKIYVPLAKLPRRPEMFLFCWGGKPSTEISNAPPKELLVLHSQTVTFTSVKYDQSVFTVYYLAFCVCAVAVDALQQ